MDAGLYAIVNHRTGMTYYGFSQALTRRLQIHRTALIRGRHHNRLLQAEWSEHGELDFAFKVIMFSEIAFAKEMEGKLIGHAIKRSRCYNLIGGYGSNTGTREVSGTLSKYDRGFR